jgi:hypothetical protein
MGKICERQPLNLEVAGRVVGQVETQPDARFRPEVCLLYQLVGAGKLGGGRLDGIGGVRILRRQNEQPSHQKTNLQKKGMAGAMNPVVGSAAAH